MKVVWIALPILALVVVVLARMLAGRPISRHTLNVVVALYLLVYLLVTAGLGLFWVARMDLPAFDLHYLFGYSLLALTAWHLWFQLPVLSAFFRKVAPLALVTPDRRQWRRGARWAGWAILLALLTAAVVLLALEFARPKPVIILPMQHPAPGSLSEPVLIPQNSHSSGGAPPRMQVQLGESKLTAAEYLHRESSFTRFGVLRLPRFVGQRPDEFKPYADKQWIALPSARRQAGVSWQEALAAGSGRSRAPDAAITLQELSDLLFHTCGVTELRHYPGAVLHLRAAASAGALYPTDVYVLARAVEKLSPGLYYYHAARHSLARIAGDDAIEGVGRATAQPQLVRAAPLTVIFTAVFDRTVWKYSIRSYRYVTLDTGHVAGNLSLAATALGLPCRFSGRFDDEQLTRIVQADPQHEVALLVAWLGVTPNAAGVEVVAIPACAPLALPPNTAELEFTRLSHMLTSWRWVRGRSRRPEAPNVPPPPAAAPDWITLSRGSESRADLFEIIRARRSFREYPDRAVSQEDLAGVLRDSFSMTGKLDGADRLRLYVVVRKVDRLAAGAYRYRLAVGGGGALEPVARGDFSANICSAGLSQELLARAAFVLVWTLDMQQVGKQDGERDYRHACMETGMAGETAYLAAVARGLGICGVGAFYDDEVDAILRLRGTSHRSLYLMGVGVRH